MCEHTEEGKAITAYLSPLNAMIDATLMSEPGRIYHAICAHEFDPSVFVRDHENQLKLAIQIGWTATRNGLIERPLGGIASYAFLQSQWIPSSSPSPIELSVDEHILRAHELSHEHAGLFAHAEATRHFLQLDPRKQNQIVTGAIQRIHRSEAANEDWDQLALYDHEMGDWHFVPRTIVDDMDV